MVHPKHTVSREKKIRTVFGEKVAPLPSPALASPAVGHWGTCPLKLASGHQFGDFYSRISPVGSGSEHQYITLFPHAVVHHSRSL